MIIKSMSRKDASFRELIDYIISDNDLDKSQFITQNIIGFDIFGIVNQFNTNAEILPVRKNGNILFHEILSLPHSENISVQEQANILHKLADEYLTRRAPDHLAFGVVHKDKDHAHIHLMISANPVFSPKRTRLTKRQFKAIQRDMEQLKTERYPELSLSSHYQDDYLPSPQRIKILQAEREAIRRERKPSQKQEISVRISLLLTKARSLSELNSLLSDHDMTLYESRKAIGVLDNITDKKYRLKTLGLEKLYKESIKRYQLIEDRSLELFRIRQKQAERQQERSHEQDDDFDHKNPFL